MRLEIDAAAACEVRPDRISILLAGPRGSVQLDLTEDAAYQLQGLLNRSLRDRIVPI